MTSTLAQIAQNSILHAEWADASKNIVKQSEAGGLIVQHVAAGSLGESLGLQIGDIVLQLNGTVVSDSDLYNVLANIAECNYVIYRPSAYKMLIAKTRPVPLGTELAVSEGAALRLAREGNFFYSHVMPLSCQGAWEALDMIADMLSSPLKHRNLMERICSFQTFSFSAPDAALATFVKGCAAYELGNMQASIAAFKEYRKSYYYNYPSDFSALYHYYQSKIAYDQGDVELARTEIQHAGKSFKTLVYTDTPFLEKIKTLYHQLTGEVLSHASNAHEQKQLPVQDALSLLQNNKIVPEQRTIEGYLSKLSDGQGLMICCMPSIRAAGLYAEFLMAYNAYYSAYQAVMPHMVMITDSLHFTNDPAMQIESSFMAQHPHAMTVLHDDTGSLFDDWGIHSYPYILLLNHEGMVKHAGLPEHDAEWINMLGKL